MEPLKDTQILSAFQSLAPASGPVSAPATPVPNAVAVFDACHVGVVLRSVLGVELVLAVGALYSADTPLAWVQTLALLTGAALPATLLWLVVGCALKRWLVRWPEPAQIAFGVALGAVAGDYGLGLLRVSGLLDTSPWLAAAASGALLSAVLITALRWRARRMAPAAAAARLRELQARIRPHFLFNTLNSAIALVRAEPAKAEALLEDLSDLFRQALAEPGQTVTVASEIELAQRYLAIEQVRFGERLRVDWSLDAGARGAVLPPLLLQPLVENAVVHGVEPSPTGAQIRISTQRRGGHVIVKVTNTVPAGSGANGQGMALDNVRERLALLHDVQARFDVGLHDGVFQARIEVPA